MDILNDLKAKGKAFIDDTVKEVDAIKEKLKQVGADITDKGQRVCKNTGEQVDTLKSNVQDAIKKTEEDVTELEALAKNEISKSKEKLSEKDPS